MDFAGFAVVNFGGLADVHAHGNHAAFFHNHAFHDFGTCADKAVVFNNGGGSLQRFQHAANAHAAAQMHVFTDLRARTHGRPSVHHRTFVHIRTDVHIRRHQHHVFADKAAASRHRTGHSTETRRLKIRLRPLREFGRHFIEKLVHAIAQHHVVLNTERQQHGFFRPLVHLPLAHAQALGHAQAAVVQLAQRFQHGFLHFGRHGLRCDFGAVFKSGLDNVLQ